MSSYGKLNLVAMLTVPLVAALGSVLMFGVRLDTQAFVFVTNGIPMLIGAVAAAVLLRVTKKSDKGRLVALWPTLVPAAAGILWYLYGLVVTGPDSGREYFAGPFYLLAGVVAMIVVSTLAITIATAIVRARAT